MIQFRERGTYDKRIDGANSDLDRFVDHKVFHEIATHFADLGNIVVRLGDKNQVPMPKHKNIIDLPFYENKTMMDDLFVMSKSKVFISTDSGIWPIAGAMRKNMILTNFTSFYGGETWRDSHGVIDKK